MPNELQPVHMQVLDYLQRANRFSDTPLAVGEYLGLTKGNISQRLNVLENLDLIRKTADEYDGRVVHLRVTSAGKRLLASRASSPLTLATRAFCAEVAKTCAGGTSSSWDSR